jgi:hypothetical protein
MVGYLRGVPPCRLFLLSEKVANEDKWVKELVTEAGLFPKSKGPPSGARTVRRRQREG